MIGQDQNRGNTMMTKESAKQRVAWDKAMFAKHGIVKYFHFWGRKHEAH